METTSQNCSQGSSVILNDTEMLPESTEKNLHCCQQATRGYSSYFPPRDAKAKGQAWGRGSVGLGICAGQAAEQGSRSFTCNSTTFQQHLGLFPTVLKFRTCVLACQKTGKQVTGATARKQATRHSLLGWGDPASQVQMYTYDF